MKNISRIFLLLTAGMLNSPSAWACAVCFGNPDSQSTKAAQAGILVLLAITAFVLACIGAFIIHFWRRAKFLEKSAQDCSSQG